jgi:hypothetical protein
MYEIFILLVAVFGFSAIQAAILAHRHLLPRRLLQGVERKSTGRNQVCLKRWQASILQLAVAQAGVQPIEACLAKIERSKKGPRLYQ